jgi:phospholipase/carboxylesterase
MTRTGNRKTKTRPDLFGTDLLRTSFGPEGAPQKKQGLLVLLHGFGQTNRNMEQATREFQHKFPALAVITPNAPHKVINCMKNQADLEMNMRRHPFIDWPSALCWQKPMVLRGTDTHRERWDSVSESARYINAEIDGALKKEGLTDKDVVIYGFSQGGMAALQAALVRAAPCAGVVGHSGYLVDTDPGLVVSKPRALLLAGADELDYPGCKHEETLRNFQALGISVEGRVIEGSGHWMDEKSFAATCDFVERALPSAAVRGPASQRVRAPARRPR